MAGVKSLVDVSVWVLFLFGAFCLIDGLVAFLTGAPCWIVRLIFGPVSLLFGSLLVFLQSKIEGKAQEGATNDAL